MKVISLQSGSNGNCFYIESGNTRILVDAGISARKAEQRLAIHGRDIRDVQALFITHDHSDHSRSIGVFQRKFGFPVYITPRTLAAVQRSRHNGSFEKIVHFEAGEFCRVNQLTVHSIPTPHDSADGVAFVIEDGIHRVGILTDLGHVFDGLREVLESLDAVVIESNYDETLLDMGPYPYRLKRRIRGEGGHLSNEDAAKVLSQHARKIQWACLCHLSEENNCPEVAIRTHQQYLGEDICIYVAEREDVGRVMELKQSDSA